MNLLHGMTSQKNYSKLTTIQKWLKLLKRKGLAWIMNAWWNFPSPITSVRDKLRDRSRVSRNITDSLTWIPSTVHSAMTYLHAEKFFKVLRTRPETLSIIMYIVWIFFFSGIQLFPRRMFLLLSHTSELSTLNFDRVIIERHRRLLWWVPPHIFCILSQNIYPKMNVKLWVSLAFLLGLN